MYVGQQINAASYTIIHLHLYRWSNAPASSSNFLHGVISTENGNWLYIITFSTHCVPSKSSGVIYQNHPPSNFLTKPTERRKKKQRENYSNSNLSQSSLFFSKYVSARFFFPGSWLVDFDKLIPAAPVMYNGHIVSCAVRTAMDTMMVCCVPASARS